MNQVKKTSTSDDETLISFEYLKDNTKEFFREYSDIFDLDLKEFFSCIALQEEKYIDYNLLSEKISLPSGDVLNFFKKYSDLYNFWTSALVGYSSNDIKSQQRNFLKDLLNGFNVYKNILKPKKKSNYEAEDLYLKLLGRPDKTVNDMLFLKNLDKYKKEIYSQAKTLFDLREGIFKKLVDKEIIENNPNQSGIDV